jgi:lysophospholipase L1-like esterase
VKILIRGGSVAAGWGVRRNYADIIRENLLPQGIDVINRSRHRETTFDGVASFSEDIDAFKPGILLFNFGIDDAFQGVYRSEFQENMVQLIRLARVRFAPAIVLATSHGFADPHDMSAVGIFYRSLRIVSRDLACSLIPVHYHFASYLEDNGLEIKDLVQSDPRYPNEKGHEVIADIMMEGLKKIISRPPV